MSQEPIDQLITLSRAEAPTTTEFQASSRLKTQFTRRRQARRQRITALTISTLVAGSAVIAFWPQPAVASFSTVLASTSGASYYYSKDNYSQKFPDYQNEYEKITWQFPDRAVEQDKYSEAASNLGPNAGIHTYPPLKYTEWKFADGRLIHQNPLFGPALASSGKPQGFAESDTLRKLELNRKVLSSTRGVSAHGQILDRYVLSGGGRGQLPENETVYADPSTHRIRFVDMGPDTIKNISMEEARAAGINGLTSSRIEYRYLSVDQLNREAPKTPTGSAVQTTSDCKKKFLAGIGRPAGTQTVNGTPVTLYGVIVREPGIVYALTQGGSARSEEDSVHDLQILKARTRKNEIKIPWVDGVIGGIDGSRNFKHVAFSTSIAGKDYVMNSGCTNLVGEVPSLITIKVPVWKLDKSQTHYIKDRGKIVSYHPSLFVGYAKFTTSKIYKTQAGGLGSQSKILPSSY